MDARLLFLLVIFAGCSSETASSPIESSEAVSAITYAEASRVFEAEQKKYEKLVEFHAAAVERQKKELESNDSAKAEQSAALIDKLAARQAEQTEKLGKAKRLKNQAYLREHPSTQEDFDKATGPDSGLPQFKRLPPPSKR